jgi:hypothetical protein
MFINFGNFCQLSAEIAFFLKLNVTIDFRIKKVLCQKRQFFGENISKIITMVFGGHSVNMRPPN